MKINDIIRSANCGLNTVPITYYDKTPVVTMEALVEYADRNGIEDIDTIVEDLQYYNDFNDIIIEALDVDAINKTRSGYQYLDSAIHRLTALVLRRNYNSIDELSRYIEECDRAIKSLREEREKAKDQKNNDSYKFSLKYFLAIYRSIRSLCVSVIVVSGTNKSFINKAFAIYNIICAIQNIPKYVFHLVISFNDYDKLLVIYIREIQNIQSNLISKRSVLMKKQSEEKKKNKSKR